MPVFVDPRTGEQFPSVPEEDVGRAQTEFGLVTLEQYEKDQAYAKLPLADKAGQAVRTGFEGLAGFTNAVTEPLGIGGTPEEHEILRQHLNSPEALERRERNPISYAVGSELPTMVAGAGLGAAATTLRGGVAALGAESALSGGARELQAASLEDREFSVSAALSNGATDFLFGAVPFGLGAAAARKTIPKIGKNLLAEAEETAGTAASQRAFRRGESRWMSEAEDAPMGGMSGAARSAGSAADDFTDDVWDKAIKSIDDNKLDREAIFLDTNSDHVLQLTTNQVADNFDEVNRILKEDINEAVRSSDFRAGAESWTDDMVRRQDKFIRAEVNQGFEEAIQEVKRAKADVGVGEGWDAGGLGSEAITLLRNERVKIMAAEGAEKNVVLNRAKQGLDKMIKRVQNNRTYDDSIKAGLIGVLEKRANRVRDALVDADMFGRNADIQRSLNEAYVETLDSWKRIQNRTQEILEKDFGQVGAASLNYRSRSDLIGAILRKPVEIQREFAEDLAKSIDGLESLSKARSDHGLTQLDQMEPLRGRLRELRDDFNMASTLQVAKRRAKDIKTANPSLAESVANEAINAIPGVGGAKRVWQSMKNTPSAPRAGTPLAKALDQRMKAYSKNPRLSDASYSRALPEWMRGQLKGHGAPVAGAAALLGGSAALAPGEAGAAEMPQDPRVVEALNNVTRSTKARVEAAVTDLFDAGLGKAKKGKQSFETGSYKALLKKAEKNGQTLAMTRFLGKRHSDPIEAYEEKKALLSQMMADPEHLASRMAASWGDLPEQQPEVFTQMVMQASKVAAYLHAKLPVTTGKSLLNKSGFPPTNEEIEEYAGHWQGAVDPLSVIDDIASGNVSEEAMEAVKANWPPVFKSYQGAALGQMTRLMEAEDDVDIGTIEYLDRVLELEGAGEPMLGWDMALMIQEAEAYVAKHPGEAGEDGQPAKAPPTKPLDTAAPQRLASKSLQNIRVPA